MSLEWGVYRQKPYGWQVWRQRKAAWTALEMDSLTRRAAWFGVLDAGSGAAMFPAPTGLGLPAEIA